MYAQVYAFPNKPCNVPSSFPPCLAGSALLMHLSEMSESSAQLTTALCSLSLLLFWVTHVAATALMWLKSHIYLKYKVRLGGIASLTCHRLGLCCTSHFSPSCLVTCTGVGVPALPRRATIAPAPPFGCTLQWATSTSSLALHHLLHAPSRFLPRRSARLQPAPPSAVLPQDVITAVQALLWLPPMIALAHLYNEPSTGRTLLFECTSSLVWVALLEVKWNLLMAIAVLQVGGVPMACIDCVGGGVVVVGTQ